jgi:hypothetical protein
VHWKASAKRGQLVTKVYQVERSQEVYVIVDASRLSAREAKVERESERPFSTTLERRGVRFALPDPARLTAQLVAQHAEVKARQLL